MFELLAQQPRFHEGHLEVPLALITYLWMAICLYKIATKTGHSESAFFAFIPILNVVLLFWIADWSLWWLLAGFMPPLFLIVLVLAFMDVCRARGRSALLGLLILLPVVHYFLMGYLAFVDPE